MQHERKRDQRLAMPARLCAWRVGCKCLGYMQRVWCGSGVAALTEKHIKRSKHVQQKIILISAGVEPLRCLYVPKLPQPQRWG